MPFAIHADAVRLVLPFVGGDFTRHSLQGVNFEVHHDGGILAVTTDGHALAIARDTGAAGAPDDGCQQFLITREIRDALKVPGRRNLKRKFPRYLVSHGQNILTVTRAENAEQAMDAPVVGPATVALSCSVESMPGLPSWRAVLPDAKHKATTKEAWMNPYLLDKFLTAYSAIVPKPWFFRINSSVTPKTIFFNCEHYCIEYFGVLMPITAQNPTPDAIIPSWLEEPK